MERKPPTHLPYTIISDTTDTVTTNPLKFDGIKLPERENKGGDNIFLILPTSLCAGQVAVKYANKISFFFFKYNFFYLLFSLIYSLFFFLPSIIIRK